MEYPTIAPKFLCWCCGDIVDLNRALVCPKDHVRCVECVERELGVAVGSHSVVRCKYENTCEEVYTDVALTRATTDIKLKKGYDETVAALNLIESGVENLYNCPFCSNACILESSATTHPIFVCDGCNKRSCRMCNQEEHKGPCDPRLRQEEELTEKFILRCYCQSPLVRGDGCNKLSCTTCRRKWCWICKKHLGANAYDHFQNNNSYLDWDDFDDRCVLYGDRPETQAFAERDETIVSRKRLLDNGEVISVKVDNGKGKGKGKLPEIQECREIGVAMECILPAIKVPDATEELPQRKPKRVCVGLVMKTGVPCKARAKRHNLCGRHQKQRTL